VKRAAAAAPISEEDNAMEVAVVREHQGTGASRSSNVPLRGLLAERERLREECRRQESETRALLEIVEELEADNTDLQESTLMWIDLYERQLERANRAVARLDGVEHQTIG
jgi:predicted nuclease with TOPRIM domain